MAFQYTDHHVLGMDAAAGNPGYGAGVGGAGWEREKAAVAAHPLYERLLEAHVACLRVATPVDQLPRIDAQIAARPPPVAAAAALGGSQSGGEDLDLFMVSEARSSSFYLPRSHIARCGCLVLRCVGLSSDLDFRCLPRAAAF
jgi:hypothetical protein